MHKLGTKTTLVFLPADGEASRLLLPSLVSLQSGGTVQPENTYSQGGRSGLRKPKKDKHQHLITATTSVHLPKPVSTDLTIKWDSGLTNPIGKDGVRTWSV